MIRGISTAFVAVAASFSIGFPALAGVSEDLVFCSKVGSDKAKLACFEAIARKDKEDKRPFPARASRKPQRSLAASIAAASSGARMWSNYQPAMSPFAGSYVFGGVGSYVPTSRPDGPTPYPAGTWTLGGLGYIPPGPLTTMQLSGGFVQGGVGYNAVSGAPYCLAVRSGQRGEALPTSTAPMRLDNLFLADIRKLKGPPDALGSLVSLLIHRHTPKRSLSVRIRRRPMFLLSAGVPTQHFASASSAESGLFSAKPVEEQMKSGAHLQAE